MSMTMLVPFHITRLILSFKQWNVTFVIFLWSELSMSMLLVYWQKIIKTTQLVLSSKQWNITQLWKIIFFGHSEWWKILSMVIQPIKQRLLHLSRRMAKNKGSGTISDHSHAIWIVSQSIWYTAFALLEPNLAVINHWSIEIGSSNLLYGGHTNWSHQRPYW